MNYEEDELLLYDEYLNDIRDMVIKEYNLDIKEPYKLEFMEIEMLVGKMKFVISEDGETALLIYEGMTFDDWLLAKRRNDKLEKLLDFLV
jgi:hypothetical protein